MQQAQASRAGELTTRQVAKEEARRMALLRLRQLLYPDTLQLELDSSSLASARWLAEYGYLSEEITAKEGNAK
jgi:hypothetical protein